MGSFEGADETATFRSLRTKGSGRAQALQFHLVRAIQTFQFHIIHRYSLYAGFILNDLDMSFWVKENPILD